MHDRTAAQERPLELAADSPVYLKSNVTVEPLVLGWLAWSHLLAPVQAALNISFRYLPLLESFVANPMVHVAATRDPKLFGGPFVHLPVAAVPQVKELIADTRTRFRRLLQLAADMKSFNASLQESCKGFSLNEVYARIPQSLAGLVELMYDIDHHPRMRLFEELLYAEYGPELRSGAQQISISDVSESARRFFMSTPRIRSADTLVINSEYANPALDMLASMRSEPVQLTDLERAFALNDLNTRYGHLFTPEPPARNGGAYTADGVRIRYFGHACVLIQTADTNILIDPMVPCAAGETDSAPGCSRFTISELPERIDYAILTHSHHDHFSPEMLLQLRPRVRKVVIPLNNRGSVTDPSMKLVLAQLGYSDIVSLGYFDSVSFESGRVVSVPFPGEHSDLDVYSKQSLFVAVKNRRLLFLVDSDCWDAALYRNVAKQIAGGTSSRLDALFLGMECHGAPLTWLYGPLLTKPVTRRDDESRRLSGSNFERAQRILQQFECDRVYVYAMGQEPWLRHIMGLQYEADSIQLTESAKFVEYCRAAGMTSDRLYGSQDLLL